MSAATAALKYTAIRKSDEVKEDPSKMAPELDPRRRFCITASAMDKVMQTSRYGGWEEVLPSILGLKKWDGNDATRLGKKMEWHIAEYFTQVYKKEFNSEAKRSQPEFQQHPVLRFIAATGDGALLMVDEKTGEPLCGFEIKFRGGNRRLKPVDLQRWGGDSDYKAQVFTQMMVYDWSQNYLVVQSDVNLDFYLYEWDPKWWRDARPKVMEFYRYLRWYWEDLERTAEETKPVREAIAKYRSNIQFDLDRLKEVKAKSIEWDRIIEDAKANAQMSDDKSDESMYSQFDVARLEEARIRKIGVVDMPALEAKIFEHERNLQISDEKAVAAMFACRPIDSDIATMRKWASDSQKKCCMCTSHAVADSKTHTHAFTHGHEIELRERPAGVEQWVKTWHPKLCCDFRQCRPKKPRSNAEIWHDSFSIRF